MAKKRSRIYWRERGGARRAYADFRDFLDVGGGREALVPEGQKLATDDPDVAQFLVGQRLKELEERRRGKALGVVQREVVTLADFARRHLIERKQSGAVTDEWLTQQEGYLRAAIGFFGAERDITALGVADVKRWLLHLRKHPNRRGGMLTGWTVRHYLNGLSNLYRSAQDAEVVPVGFNPASAVRDKPRAHRPEARWLEVHEAALLLEVARMYRPKRGDVAVPFAFPLLATFLLTGGRHDEVVGLEAEDVSFDRKTVTFRPNTWRRLKTERSHRTVPLWPQLEEILRPYVFGADAPPGRLLFPSLRTGREAMLTDSRKVLDAVAARGGWAAGAIRSKMFRHTYCAARLQTLDRGDPVSLFTVARELGHGSTSMVEKVYSHLGHVRHRADVVEYRVADHLSQQVRDGQTVRELLRTLA